MNEARESMVFTCMITLVKFGDWYHYCLLIPPLVQYQRLVMAARHYCNRRILLWKE